MARLAGRTIARAFERGDAAKTTVERGRALEDLLVYIFSKIPGVRLHRRNALTEDLSGEIDLIFWNDRSALNFLPNILMFECKNWSAPVDSASVSFFISKVTTRHLTHAFLVAANGLTGDNSQRTAANAHLHNALVLHDCKIVVLNREDLLDLGSTDELVQLIIQKISELYLLGV